MLDERQRVGGSDLLPSAAQCMQRRTEDEIDEQYRRAYADGEGLGDEWEGWIEEAAELDR
jgi:hypothetical protein